VFHWTCRILDSVEAKTPATPLARTEADKMKKDAGQLRERLDLLLNGFSVVAGRGSTSVAPVTARIRTLLKQFSEHRDRANTLEQSQAANDRHRIHALLHGYNETLEGYRQKQKQVADDFNLLEVMRLTGKEIRHSMVLAWLLDHDMRKLGTHAQGDLGFRLFLSEFSIPIDYAGCKYWVRREVAGDESVVDVEVAYRGRFLIHIENKIWSCEGTDQTNREWSDMQRQAADLNVSASDIHALYLTPHGTEPANPNFRAIPWGRIVRVLERFAEEAKPPDVKLFARHYARALRRFIVIQDISEEDHAERTLERS
jgi:hypothetical protein